MKRIFCILAATIILSLLMTGCGERGKIGNGENGTMIDNKPNISEKSTEDRTENRTDSTNNNTNNNNSNNTDNNTNSMAGDDNNDTIPYTEQNTDDSTQQGLAGRVGDAIDEGVADLGDAITGQDNSNTSNNNSDTLPNM